MSLPFDLPFQPIFKAQYTPVPISPMTISSSVPGRRRILLISDTLLGAGSQPAAKLATFISALSSVIKADQITHVIHLGNLVDKDAPNSLRLLDSVINELVKLRVPTWLLGGDRDRDVFARLTGGNRRGSVTIVRQVALIVELTGGRKLWLTHDLGNPYPVTDQFAWSYAFWLKENAAGTIQKEDWLLIGHCHTQFLSTGPLIGAVGQFAPGAGAATWTVVVDGERLSIEHKSEAR
jgi:hypothetical protein